MSVTLVTCTCKRLDYFERTIASLIRNLDDFALIERLLVIDDNSTESDRNYMREQYPQFQFVWKDAGSIGHAKSLNIMLDEVRTDYALYWEDDCVLANRGRWLSQALAVMQSGAPLLSVSLDPCILADARCAMARLWAEENQPFAHAIGVALPPSKYSNSRDFNYGRDPWPGYSLKPHLLALERARRCVGRFDVHNRDHMEYDYSLRAMHAGLKVAVLYGPMVTDLGAARSAYVLNDQGRGYDTAA